MSDEDRYYQLVLIWMRDPEMFGRFVAEASPAASRFEAAERLLAPTEVYGEGVPLPDIANVVFYPSEQAYRDLQGEPAFRAALPLRSGSIDMLSVWGRSVSGAVSGAGLAERLYLVEVARYGEGGEAAYRRYEEEAEAVMAPYGYHVERVIRPGSCSEGLPFRPDLVKIAYFDDAAGMQRLHEDPGHARVEGELYTAAVAESLWLVARPLTSLPVGA